MTSAVATRFGLQGRGLLQEAMVADVVLFDGDQVEDRATFEEPTLEPAGISWVWVGGRAVVEEGVFVDGTGAGVVLTPFAPLPPPSLSYASPHPADVPFTLDLPSLADAVIDASYKGYPHLSPPTPLSSIPLTTGTS